MYCKYFLPVDGLPFHLLNEIFQKAVASFCIGTRETKDKTEWHNCIAWDKTADFISKYFVCKCMYIYLCVCVLFIQCVTLSIVGEQ